jgi:hypothetical protein
MGIFWIMSLILEVLMLVAYAILATGFIGLYNSRKQAIMLRLFIFAISMIAFFGIMIYLTYYLALRFGYPAGLSGFKCNGSGICRIILPIKSSRILI